MKVKTRQSALLLVLAVGLLLPGCAVLGSNLRTVERGEAYRSGQMGPVELARVIDRLGIGMVVNLRGENPGEQWYRDEVAVCERLGVRHESLSWSMRRLPDPESLARFVELCETGPRPMLVHCQGGVHRTGVASACYVLVTGEDMPTARGQLGLFFRDAPIGRLLDLYEESDMPFGEWVRAEYPAIHAGATSDDNLRRREVVSSDTS